MMFGRFAEPCGGVGSVPDLGPAGAALSVAARTWGAVAAAP